MEAVMFLQESLGISESIQNLRAELTSAILTAQVKHEYDKDIQLSFGLIHINPQGSVSQISFHGTDIEDLDAFVVKQALQVSDENYFDIRKEIKDHPEEFNFFPIQINGKISLTVLKSSPYFEKKYGPAIHYDDVRVDYASKYIIIRRSGWEKPDIYLSALGNPRARANADLSRFGKALGGKSKVFYCFLKSKPEQYLQTGLDKEDFQQYHPEKNPDRYSFYTASIINGFYKFNKETDANGKVKVKETNRNCFRLIIDMQYGSIQTFCEEYGIDKLLLQAYLNGISDTIQYKNGNKLTPSRIKELLNIPFDPNVDTLKDKNLLVKVEYDDIPE